MNSANRISYLTFKELATAIGSLVSETGRQPTKDHAARSLRVITDNGFEAPLWVGEARHRLKLPKADDPRMARRAWLYEHGQQRQAPAVEAI